MSKDVNLMSKDVNLMSKDVNLMSKYVNLMSKYVNLMSKDVNLMSKDVNLMCFLQNTDICQHALEALAESKIRRVNLIGRRGPLQVAFTIKELREMTRLPECGTNIDSTDFDSIRVQLEG